MVLLTLLHRLGARHKWSLRLAHFNHQLRGKASDADEQFVRRVARRLDLPIAVARADTKAFACQKKMSLEMAARRLRHEFLARTARSQRVRRVALAHHADDQVELFFLRLFRGAGGEGLAGMKWVAPSPMDSKVRLIRPLLDIPRKHLEEFAREEGIRFREDATNASVSFDRNRIRHELLPFLRRDFSANLDRTVLKSMEIVGRETECIGEAARSWLERGQTGEFAQLHVAVQRQVLQEQLLALGITPEFDLIERLRLTANHPVTIARNQTVLRDTSGRIRKNLGAGATDFNSAETCVPLSKKRGLTRFDGCVISWRMRSGSNRSRGAAQRSRLECFDAERVGAVMHLRHWRAGDRFQPIGMSHHVKLQDWFVNQKVPRRQRRELVIATTADGEIFWVEGLRIGEGCKVTHETGRILEFSWSRERR